MFSVSEVIINIFRCSSVPFGSALIYGLGVWRSCSNRSWYFKFYGLTEISCGMLTLVSGCMLRHSSLLTWA